MRNRKIRDISACEVYNVDSFSCMKNKSITFCNVVSDFVNKLNKNKSLLLLIHCVILFTPSHKFEEYDIVEIASQNIVTMHFFSVCICFISSNGKSQSINFSESIHEC